MRPFETEVVRLPPAPLILMIPVPSEDRPPKLNDVRNVSSLKGGSAPPKSKSTCPPLPVFVEVPKIKSFLRVTR